MGFPKPGAADKWLDRDEPLRVVCFVSHNAADHIAESDRGHVLGVYELSPIRVNLEADNVLDVQHLSDPALRREDGRFRWPVGLRATRAWRFTPNVPKTRQAMPEARRLGFDVSTDIIPISRRDFGLLDQAAYRLEEVPVYGISWSPQRLVDPLAIPSSVYLFACAKSEILSRLPRWKMGEILVKIGCASDVDARLASFNDHPLAKIAGLKFTKVASRHVGVDRAFEEENDLLEHAAAIGRSAAETKTEFFFLPELGYRVIEARVAGVLNVA